MSTIVVTDILSVCSAIVPPQGSPLPLLGSEIDIGPEIGSGGFGAVHGCTAVDHTASTGVLVKRHDPANGIDPGRNAAVLAALHRAVEADPTIPARDRLRALPYWVGRARWGPDEVVISLSLDLVAAGYEALSPIMEEPARLRQWLSRPFTDRLAAALDMAAEHAACEAIDFVHADVNLQNAFLDADQGRMSLIDFDSGWLPGAPGTSPLVWGKPDDFIAPEAKRGGQVDVSAIGVLSERWAVGFLLHYVLFGVGPLFFLTGLSEQRITAYLADHTWPDIDQHSSLFNKPNRAFYSHYLTELADLPADAVELFRRFVTNGSADPTDRPTSAEWFDALSGLASPPTFEWVRLSSPTTVDTRPVRLSWSAPGATTVTVDGQGHYAGNDRADVALGRSRRIRLVASNPFGTVEHLTDEVAVYRLPDTPHIVLPEPRLTIPRSTIELPILDAPRQPHAVMADLRRRIRGPAGLLDRARPPLSVKKY